MRKSRLFLGMVVLAIVLSMSLLAAPTVHAITMADLLGGLDVVIGDKSFENFREYVSVGTNGALAVDPSSIFISFSITPTGLYQINYQSGAFFVGMNQIQDTRFTYDVRVITREPRLEDNSVTLLSFGLGSTNTAFDLGRVSISETVTDVTGGFLAQELVYDDHGNVVLSASRSWSPPVAQLTVRKDIGVSGDNREGGGAFLSDFAQIFSQTAVPEPATMLLLGSGLILLAGYGRKKFFKK